jgi:hypothetical protein
MKVPRPAAPIITCRRIADDRLVLHVIDRGVCAAVSLSRQHAAHLIHDLLLAVAPAGTRPAAPRPTPSRPRRAGGRR